MPIYTITEKQTLGSTRKGNAIQAKNLTEAKRIATRNKMFKGTVLTIELNGKRVAYKKDGVWEND